METGFVFWTVAKPNMSLRTRVLVAWDFTHDRPADVVLKQEGDVDMLTEPDTFSIPVIEHVSVIDMSLCDIFSISESDDEGDSTGLLLSL
jgi:hypothetical protein